MRPQITVEGKTYTLLGYKEDFKPGTGRHYQINDQHIAIFPVGDKFYAIDNECPHEGSSLSEGTLDGDIIICPLHAWMYRVTDGENITTPGTDVATYPVLERDGKIFVAL